VVGFRGLDFIFPEDEDVRDEFVEPTNLVDRFEEPQIGTANGERPGTKRRVVRGADADAENRIRGLLQKLRIDRYLGFHEDFVVDQGLAQRFFEFGHGQSDRLDAPDNGKIDESSRRNRDLFLEWDESIPKFIDGDV